MNDSGGIVPTQDPDHSDAGAPDASDTISGDKPPEPPTPLPGYEHV
jgi:hypothetical protein